MNGMRLKPSSLQRGTTIVEIMVTLAIGLFITLAVAVAYVASRTTATAVDSQSRMNEAGKQALDFLAREVQMAGFYPASVTDPVQPSLRGRYSNIKGQPAYQGGIFGCDNAPFLPSAGGCGAVVAGAPDSLVVNYFVPTSPRDVGVANASVGRDCLNQPLATDPDNAARAAAGLPLLLSNRFTATASGYDSAVGAVNVRVDTLALACNGNGVALPTDNYAQLYEGVAQLVFRYAVHDFSSGETPQRFFTATEVSAMPVMQERNGWQRVSGVSICVLMRSLVPSRTASQGAGGATYTDCSGNAVSPGANDRFFYQRFARVVAVRNQLTGLQ